MPILLTLLWLAPDFESVKTPGNIYGFRASLTESGDVIAFVGKNFFHWNKEGALLRTFSCEGQIFNAFDSGPFYLMTLPRTSVKDMSRGTAAFYDHQGALVGVQDANVRYTNQVDGRLFTPLDAFIQSRHNDADYRPFLVRHTLLRNEGAAYSLAEGEVRFFRLPRLMRRHHLNFKRTWVVTDSLMATSPKQFLKDGGQFWVVWELEARVYRYSASVIQKELVDPAFSPPYSELDLSEFVPSSSGLYRSDRPMPAAEYAQKVQQNLASFSRILWFGKHKDAYAVAYSFKSDSLFLPPMEVVVLDRALKRVRTIKLEGGYRVLGSHGGKLVVVRAEWVGTDDLHLNLERLDL